MIKEPNQWEPVDFLKNDQAFIDWLCNYKCQVCGSEVESHECKYEHGE